MNENVKKEIFTVPNILSLFRLALIPVYVYLYLTAQKPMDYVVAAVILAVSTLTDMLDGMIARHYHMISYLGKILDPLADKATQGVMIICLGLRHPVIWIMFGLFFIKESFMVVVGFINLRRGRMLKGALIAGKVCTTVLFISLILLVLIPDMSQTGVYVLTGICLLFMLFSFAMYFAAYFGKQDQLEQIDSPIVGR